MKGSKKLLSKLEKRYNEVQKFVNERISENNLMKKLLDIDEYNISMRKLLDIVDDYFLKKINKSKNNDNDNDNILLRVNNSYNSCVKKLNYDNLEEFDYSVKNCIEGVVNINTGYRIVRFKCS